MGSNEMVRYLGVTVLLILSACNAERDDRDYATEMFANRLLAEYREIDAHRPMFQLEQATIRKQLARYSKVSAEEFEHLAGPDLVAGAREPNGFFSRNAFSSPGTPADAVRFLRRALTLSSRVAADRVELTDGHWTVRLAIIGVDAPRTARPEGRGIEPSPDTSSCYTSCQERQQRIRIQASLVADLKEKIGPLANLNREKKELRELTEVRAKLAGPDLAPLIDHLEAAEWLSSGVDLQFDGQGLVVEGVPFTDDACDAAFAGLAACSAVGPGPVARFTFIAPAVEPPTQRDGG